MRALQMLRLGGPDVKCVSLRRSSVAATDGALGRSSDVVQLQQNGEAALGQAPVVS